jgi:hypothetical protein
LKLGHSGVLDSLLKDIARRSPPPSPTPTAARPLVNKRSPQTITWATQEVTKMHGEDDYGFAYEDDAEEDMDSLSLCRTVSRKPQWLQSSWRLSRLNDFSASRLLIFSSDCISISSSKAMTFYSADF